MVVGAVPASPGPSADPLEWHFSQVFGERTPGEEVQEADIISAVEFDHTGDFLATGDQGGRVVLFERIAARQRACPPDQRPASPLRTNPYEYRYLTEFQSHEPEFDYLKSLEIEEKINKVRWCRRAGGGGGRRAHLLLTTNDKTVKLWKVFEKRLACLAEFNLQNASSALNSGRGPYGPSSLSPDKVAGAGGAPGAAALRLPRVVSSETVLATQCRRVFSNAHAYHINSVALSSDQESFVSADDLRINLWHLDRPDQAFNVVDIKPASMEDLTEVITAADFHPQSCNIFGYSSSKGCIRLADMRAAALCDQHAKLFEDSEPAGAKSFFTEIITSINDVKFSRDGRYILSRDYMTLKLWDVNMENAPVAVYPVQEALRGKLCELYENDCIFDKFDCCMSGDGRHFATGTYSNFFRSASRLAPPAGPRFGLGRSSGGARRSSSAAEEAALSADYSMKLLHLSWHPEAPVVATAAANSLYLFYGQQNRLGP
eukprot:scaffold3.g6675.t1